MTTKAEAVAKAARELYEFAWTAVTADCEESRQYLNKLVAGIRAAIALPDDPPCAECARLREELSLIASAAQYDADARDKAEAERDALRARCESLQEAFDLSMQDVRNLTQKVIPNVREEYEARIEAQAKALEAWEWIDSKCRLLSRKYRPCADEILDKLREARRLTAAAKEKV